MNKKLNTYVQSTASFYCRSKVHLLRIQTNDVFFVKFGLPNVCKQLHIISQHFSVPVQYHYLSKSKQYHRIDCHLSGCMFLIASMAAQQYFPGRTEENASLTSQTSRWYCEKARRHRWTYYADRTCAPQVSSAVGFH